MSPYQFWMRTMYEGAPDEWVARWALSELREQLPQPESLDRFVRAARLQPGLWGAAATNAICQLVGCDNRTKRL